MADKLWIVDGIRYLVNITPEEAAALRTAYDDYLQKVAEAEKRHKQELDSLELAYNKTERAIEFKIQTRVELGGLKEVP